MVIRQLEAKQGAHIELREAFILLHSRGYMDEAERLYNRLLRDMEHFTDKQLFDDFQRTLLLIDPTTRRPTNLVWKYHWTVSNELEKRQESALKRAHQIAAKQEP
jgi:hypothetical protein